ncbi:MAG: nucleotidyltransferase family protein [Verrucomicrobiae bacterium]|nr:nucleotidyltransferase family protein [Verrucomicrobiae bacterium]
MKSVILAAGKGTRMKHLTADLPKPMLPVKGKPVLERIIDGLIAAGIREFCIITGYRAEVIEEHFGDGSSRGIRIEYARQITQDGTGKAPELAKAFVSNDNFVLTYGDILVAPANYKGMVQLFEREKPSGLLAVLKGEDVSKGAAVVFDKNFCLTNIVEKPAPGTVASPWYNAGIYIFAPVVYEFTAKLNKSPRSEYELPDAIMGMVRTNHRIKGFELNGYWIDVRDPEELKRAEELV